MKLFYFILLVTFSAQAEDFCSPLTNNTYLYQSVSRGCPTESDCWIGLLPPEDTFNLTFEDKPVIDHSASRTYTKYDSFYIPLAKDINSIKIESKDLNQLNRPQKELCIVVGNYQQVKLKTSFRWFLRTGSTLVSIYFLLISSLFIAFSLTIKKTSTGLALLNYCIISSIYLLSFSEIPRLFYDPVLLSGGVHFPLRIAQDFSLIYVLYHFYRANDYTHFLKKIGILYIFVLTTYGLMLTIGIHDYKYYEKIIIYFSFLVAAPIGLGLYFSVINRDSFERKVLIPFYSILFMLQINDLLCFWGIWNTYFTVKLYIPIIVSLTLFLYFRRMHNETLLKGIFEERQALLQRYVHDLKSPLAAIKVVTQDGLKETPERSVLVKSAIDRIEEMANELIHKPVLSNNIASVPLVSLTEAIIKEKEMAFAQLKVHKDFFHEVFVQSDDIILARVISNLLNNAIESYEIREPEIVLTLMEDVKNIKLAIQDFGRGMTSDIVQKVVSGGYSTKKGGKGLGISSAINQIEALNGKINIYSMPQKGSTIEITLPRGDIPFWYHTDSTISESIIEVDDGHFLNEYLLKDANPLKGYVYIGNYSYDKSFFKYLEDNSISIMRCHEYRHKKEIDHLYEFLLIDDDKYVCRAWELSMRDKGKKIKTFQSYDEFLSHHEKFNRSVKIYLDRHVKGLDLLDKIPEIYNLGFYDLTVISSDLPCNYSGRFRFKTNSNKLPPD